MAARLYIEVIDRSFDRRVFYGEGNPISFEVYGTIEQE